jgi:hypothetical protein
MHRVLQIARAALESSGDLGLALSISVLAVQYLWAQSWTDK